MRSLLPVGGTDARKAAPARGGKLPGTGGLLPLPLLLLLLVPAELIRYLRIVMIVCQGVAEPVVSGPSGTRRPSCQAHTTGQFERGARCALHII
jgi:hypothetical protein